MEDRQLIRQDQAQVKMKRKKKHQSKQLYGYPAFEFVLLDFSRNRKVQQNSMIYLRVGCIILLFISSAIYPRKDI
ncbi:hypothetical protein PV327_001787 [Microctonus hyperodae]|uniref:Uncharacterized protein n=1 Tax=Microctonus hyperodae TaxID=165561 RepID=A0AA39KNK5_MICHY|nr:hypothetical protein PV327_001787 [Microctonus hyperodae]